MIEQMEIKSVYLIYTSAIPDHRSPSVVSIYEYEESDPVLLLRSCLNIWINEIYIPLIWMRPETLEYMDV